MILINTIRLTAMVLVVAFTCSSCSSLSNLRIISNKPNTAIKLSKKSKKSSPWKHSAKQDQVFACHSFVVAGLVEAEYYRVTGKKINLSEADLFLKHIKQGAPTWDAALSLYLATGVRMENTRNLEIGHVHESYDLLRKHGIAYESEIKYSPIGIGIPLTMRILRTSVENIQEGIKAGQSQDELTEIEITQIKKDGAFKILSQEGKYFASRDIIKQFISQYNLKKIDIRNEKNNTLLKNKVAQHIVAFNFKVPYHKNHLKASGSHHTLILTGFDKKKRVFTVRDSDSKGLFGNHLLTEEFVQRFATKIYYLEKR